MRARPHVASTACGRAAESGQWATQDQTESRRCRTATPDDGHVTRPRRFGRVTTTQPNGTPESRDLEIRIRRPEKAHAPCPVSVAGPDDRVAEGSFRSPFTEEEIDRALAWMEDGTTDSVGARNFGERLFRSLFQGAVAGIYVASQDNTDPLRIRLTIDDPECRPPPLGTAG